MNDGLSPLAPPAGFEPLFLADHPVLDMLNTVPVVNGSKIDLWLTDEAVLLWLEQAGLIAQRPRAHWPKGTLAAAARRLREIARDLVESRKGNHEPLQAEPLNSFLSRGPSHLELRAHAGEKPQTQRVYGEGSPEALLAPLAEKVAELMAEGDFELVRRCEGQDCVLWFYDRTKAHRRRWCSMSMCGNRAKVAAFRQRLQS